MYIKCGFTRISPEVWILPQRLCAANNPDSVEQCNVREPLQWRGSRMCSQLCMFAASVHQFHTQQNTLFIAPQGPLLAWRCLATVHYQYVNTMITELLVTATSPPASVMPAQKYVGQPCPSSPCNECPLGQYYPQRTSCSTANLNCCARRDQRKTDVGKAYARLLITIR
jgi:hypothetical protein